MKNYTNANTDRDVIIPLKDAAGSPIDLSIYAQIKVILQAQNGLKKIVSYTTDDGTLTIQDAANGLLTFILSRSITKTLANQFDLYYIVRVYQTDADYLNDLAIDETFPTYLTTIIKTSTYDDNE